MRLFLSSYRAGDHGQQLTGLINGVQKVGVITNAKDYKTPEEREFKVAENLDFFRGVGIEPFEIDLRPYFGKSGVETILKGYDFIWLAGGNVFLLRRALSYSGADVFLSDQIRKGNLISGGESAGALIFGPTLRDSEMEGDADSPDYVAEGYEKEVVWDGLGLLDYVPVPHYQNVEYRAEINGYIARLEKSGVSFQKMTDDQAIMIKGDKKEFLS